MTSESSKGAIEIHMENLIKGDKSFWMSYKRRLHRVLELLKNPKLKTALSVNEGDSFVRFNSSSSHVSLNTLFFVYEIGKVFPSLKWRHLIGSSGGLNYFLLNKPVSYLPAFSFSLDQQVTLLYWGEQVPFLSTTDLRNLNLSNFILRVNSPNCVEVSAANLVWPKSAYFYQQMNQEVGQLAVSYLFNSLMPPILNGMNDIWSESPFVLVGDRIVTFLTIHKTICTIDEKTAKILKDRGVVNVEARVIDRSFSVKKIPVDIPEGCIVEPISRGFPCEVIFVKDIRFRYDPTSSECKPYIRYTVYPFESVKLFGGESYGWLLSIASLVLRECYLRSSNLFSFVITPEEFRQYLSKVLTLFPHGYADKQLGLRLIERSDGFSVLASSLGVYTSNGSLISYLHPALIECFIDNRGIEKSDLIRFQKVVSGYSQKANSLRSLQETLLLEELFKNEFGSIPDFKTASRFKAILNGLLNVCIPLSKALCLYPEVGNHG